jgi:GNAT superfamily N-acetyltransferase
LVVSEQPADPVGVRDFSPGDLAYLFSHWLRDLRDADPGPLPDDLFFPAHRQMLEGILADPAVAVKILCATDRPEEILGFVVAEPKKVLWWVEIRKGLRGRGLAKLLLERVDVPPGTPAAWGTVLGKIRLRNPARGRQIRASRRADRQPSTGSR